MKIIIWEKGNFGHGTIVKHEYNIPEELHSIQHNVLEHTVVAVFNTCSDKMVLHVGELESIRIER